MEDTELSRRDLGKALVLGLATLGVATVGVDSASAAPAGSIQPPGNPGSPWLIFVPDSKNKSVTVVASAVDATGINRAIATDNTLTLLVETARSTYSIVITFTNGGNPGDVFTRILSGQLRDLRDRASLKISKIEITDYSAAYILS